MFLSLIFLLPLILAAPQTNEGSLAITPEKLDFGRVFDGDEPIKHVEIKNIGQNPITINRMSTSCNCAIPRIILPSGEERALTERTVNKTICELKPGDVLKIFITFRTWGYKGELNKSVVIHSNDKGFFTRVIKIHAEIIDAVKVTPEVLDLGDMIRGQKKKAEVRIKSVGIGDFEITGVHKLETYLKFYHKKLKSGEDAEVLFGLETKEKPPMGENFLWLNPTVKNKHVKEVRVKVRLNVLPKICFYLGETLVKDELDFGVFCRKKGASMTVDIKNLAPQIPYEPLDMELEAPDLVKSSINYELKPIEKGELYRLVVKVKPGVTGVGFIRAKLKIRSYHQDCHLKTINLIGWPH